MTTKYVRVECPDGTAHVAKLDNGEIFGLENISMYIPPSEGRWKTVNMIMSLISKCPNGYSMGYHWYEIEKPELG